MRRRITDLVLPLPVVAVVLHAGCWFTMLASSTTWLGEWKAALDNAAGSVVIVGPMAAAISAATYARHRLTAVPALAATAVRPVRGWYDPALRVLAASWISFLALVVEVTVLALARGLPVEPRQLVIVPFALAMLAVHDLLGMAVGLRARALVAAPLAGSVSFGLFVLATESRAPDAFVTGGVTGSLAGEQYRLPAALLLVGVACALVVAGAAVTGWWPMRLRPVAIGVAGVAAAVALSLVMASGGGRIEFSVVHYRCHGSAPEVCVASETPRILPDAAAKLRRLSGPLRAAGVDLPRRWKESLYSTTDDLTAGELGLTADTGSRMATSDALDSLSRPATCRGYLHEPAGSIEARWVLAQWLGARNHVAFPDDPSPWFSSAASTDWVRRSYRLLRRCRLDELRAP